MLGGRFMTLLDAPIYDPAKARRRKIKIAVAIVAVIVLAGLAWMYRNWPEEHAVDKFFTALQHQDYETAYGIYFNDPGWRQHQQKYSQYTVCRLLSRLGTGRRVGSHQIPPDLRIGEHKGLWRRRRRGRSHRQRAHRTRPHVRAEIR